MQSLPRGSVDTKSLCHLPGSCGAEGWHRHGRHLRPGGVLQETDGGEEQEVRMGLYSDETDWAAGLMFASDTM